MYVVESSTSGVPSALWTSFYISEL